MGTNKKESCWYRTVVFFKLLEMLKVYICSYVCMYIFFYSWYIQRTDVNDYQTVCTSTISNLNNIFQESNFMIPQLHSEELNQLYLF